MREEPSPSSIIDPNGFFLTGATDPHACTWDMERPVSGWTSKPRGRDGRSCHMVSAIIIIIIIT